MRAQSFFILVLVGLCLLGGRGCSCAANDPTGPSPPPPPKPENIQVDLGNKLHDFKPRAQGMLRLNGPTISGEMLQRIKPLVGQSPPLLVTIGDLVKFEGAWPGEKKNWKKWDDGVAQLVRRLNAQRKNIVWEIWNEGDQKDSFHAGWDEFVAMHIHTTRLIRSVDPKAVILGPCSSSFDGGRVQEFLKQTKEYNALPDIVCWHTDASPNDFTGQVTGVSESFWQDGTNRQQIMIMQNSSISAFAPGYPIIVLAAMQQAHRDNSARQIREDVAFRLPTLVTNDGKPRPIYWAYAAYAELRGPMVKVNNNPTTDGVATFDSNTKKVVIVLGRHHTRNQSRDAVGDLTLIVKSVPWPTSKVQIEHIQDKGDKAMESPRVLSETLLPSANNELRIPLSMLLSGDACRITITASDLLPTSRPTASN